MLAHQLSQQTMLTMLYGKGKSTNWQIKKKVKFRLRQPSCQRIFIFRRFLWSLLPLFFYFCRFQSPHVLLNILLHVFQLYWHFSKYIHVILFTELNRTFYWNIKHTWPIVLTQILRGKEMKKKISIIRYYYLHNY